jgi:ribosomal protein L12E/L44/L45/RPP1/RPP2
VPTKIHFATSFVSARKKKEICMLPENQPQGFKDRLNSLWNEGSKDMAIAFLRRVINVDMTLEELARALQFSEVRGHLEGMQLQDILRQAPKPMLHTVPAAAALPQAATGPAKTRRKRRTPEEIAALRDALMGRLQAAVGSVTTSHLCDVLSNGGHDVDLLQLGRMLATLEQEGYVTCLGGKPKAWRLKPQGRRAPEPLVIRKAQNQ